MFARVFALLPLALLVSASTINVRQSECATGPAQCCTSNTAEGALKTTNNPDLQFILSLLDPTEQVGTSCESSGLVGVGNGCSADQEPICCNNNYFSGLLSIGCSPINIGL